MSQYAVVQASYEFSEWQAVAQILIDALGLHPTSAKQRARRPRGFLAEKLDRDMAECIRQACQAQGLTTYVVPEADVVVLPKAVRVHALWIADDALWFRQGPTGPKEPVAWDGIVLMAAYQVMRKESFHRWSDEYNPATRSSDLHVDEYSKDYEEYLAEIFGSAHEGGLVRLRIESRGLNYQEALGCDLPDPLRKHNAQDDSFRLVLARIHARAQRASVPPETLVLLGGEADPNCRLYELPRLEEFEAYNRWLLQMMQVSSRKSQQPPPGS